MDRRGAMERGIEKRQRINLEKRKKEKRETNQKIIEH